MAEGAGVNLSRKFVTEAELDERRKKRQEEWEKVRKPDDPEEAPEEVYDPRSLFERLQEQKDKKQEEFEEQLKFKNMVRGLDEDETSFLDEVSRQQSLVEKRRRDEEKQELLEYRIAIAKHSAVDNRKEQEKKTVPKQSSGEQRTSHLSQAHLLAGAVKRRSSSQSSDSNKKHKVENTSSSTKAAAGNGGTHTGGARSKASVKDELLRQSAEESLLTLQGILSEQEGGAPRGAATADRPQGPTSRPPHAPLASAEGVVHLPSAAVCVGVLPGLCNYSGSSDSDSSSDSEGSVDAIMSPYPRQARAYR